MIAADHIAERLLREDASLLDDAMRNATQFQRTRAGALVEIEATVSRSVAEAAVLEAYRRITGGLRLR